MHPVYKPIWCDCVYLPSIWQDRWSWDQGFCLSGSYHVIAKWSMVFFLPSHCTTPNLIGCWFRLWFHGFRKPVTFMLKLTVPKRGQWLFRRRSGLWMLYCREMGVGLGWELCVHGEWALSSNCVCALSTYTLLACFLNICTCGCACAHALYRYTYICLCVCIHRWVVCIYIYIWTARTGVLPGKCVLTSQGQRFMRFGMSSISSDGWRDLFPKHESLNPKPNNINLESKVCLKPWKKLIRQ